MADRVWTGQWFTGAVEERRNGEAHTIEACKQIHMVIQMSCSGQGLPNFEVGFPEKRNAMVNLPISPLPQ